MGSDTQAVVCGGSMSQFSLILPVDLSCDRIDSIMSLVSCLVKINTSNVDYVYYQENVFKLAVKYTHTNSDYILWSKVFPKNYLFYQKMWTLNNVMFNQWYDVFCFSNHWTKHWIIIDHAQPLGNFVKNSGRVKWV